MNIKTYVQFLGTLANENRISILLALKEKGSLCVSELVNELGMNQTTISHNLKRLQICGFVEVKIDGKFRKYSVNKETIKPLLELITNHQEKYCSGVVCDPNVSKEFKTESL